MWVISYNLCLGIDATEHVGGRLIRWVLRDKLPLHSKVKNMRFDGFYCFHTNESTILNIFNMTIYIIYLTANA